MAAKTVGSIVAHGAEAPWQSCVSTRQKSSSAARSSSVGRTCLTSNCRASPDNTHSYSPSYSLSSASSGGARRLCLRGSGQAQLWDRTRACRLRCTYVRRALPVSKRLSGDEPDASRTTRRGRQGWQGRRVATCASIDGQSTTENTREGNTERATVGDTQPPPSRGNHGDHRVLVVGASGGVGQLLVAGLLRHGYKVRALVRNKEKGDKLFGADHDGERLQLCHADVRFPDTLTPSLFEGISFVVIALGTTAYPSKRWDGDNGPEQTDYHGVRNLAAAVPAAVKRVVMVSSIGIERKESFPFTLVNIFGVLSYKKLGEECVRQCGVPYTIIRAGRLTDGPYTSYDLNTLLQATSGDRKAVILEKGDTLGGDASRISVAEACIQALQLECAAGQVYSLNTGKGDGPGSDYLLWERLFERATAK
ncbi:hypothetical protein CBR_g3452 [Chara braunii]|uniref:NAD(P)-binding domain-containing protein n=1 Tax=Chara braunii TaxID=69332 RepID=A0A388JR18_CHABU|nr:hypothetical protein CBR_g3452 [Chara braunii]|eukprot:GBG60208.1 hypothetical protein CBR_g3452 [Chara braunii]